MCGIAGKVDTGGSVAADLIESMCAAVEHRGPDSRGQFLDDGVGLGVQRLRVIDLATGDQPIFSEDGSVVVVLNGEIYNYRELRQALVSTGHRFNTESDTEVIVHLYEERGRDCVHALHGMFAFALWDRARRRLLLARDRVGKKPLFYAHRGGSLSFASELQALLQDDSISREIDYEALDDYLFFQYVPAPRTAFRSIRKLPPASTLVFENGRATVERYWRLDYATKRPLRGSGDIAEEVRDALRAAVRRRMIADVPLGALLSGGVDSSAVVAAMAEASAEPIKTFSIGFDEASHDELPFARQVASRFGTDHHELVVRPNAMEVLPTLVRHYGEPFADSSALPTFYLAQLARRHVTVALTGDGGDESFAGYTRYARALQLSRLASNGLVRPAMRVAAPILERITKPRLTRARRAARLLALDAASVYCRQICYFEEAQREALYSDEFAASVRGNSPEAIVRGMWERSTASCHVDRMLEVDVETYLPGDLLVKMDIATMAHSLEARSPFLDHELMELAASLPPDMKLASGQTKAALRSALRGWLPDEILDRPKQGFGVPIADWLRGDLKDYVRDVLLDDATVGRGLFRLDAVSGLIDSHAGGRDESPRIWALLVLELWFREVVDAPPASPAEQRPLAVV